MSPEIAIWLSLAIPLVGAPLIVSDDTVAAARREGADGAVIGRLRRGGTSAVRGRKEGISFWRLDAPAPAGP